MPDGAGADLRKRASVHSYGCSLLQICIWLFAYLGKCVPEADCNFPFAARTEGRTLIFMNERDVRPGAITPEQSDKPVIAWEEAFYLALAATVMKQFFATYRKDWHIDECLSDAEAAGIVLARTIAKDFAMPASARRAGAILHVFFVDAICDWFDSELEDILRDAGGTGDVEDYWPGQGDLHEAMRMDFAKLAAQGEGKGWGRCGDALKAPYRLYWEEHLQARI